ncbi:MAG: site-specific integrase [Bacteroidaceae bacterium]|nr:site-specific integrase [Bacteroidaceae bacterium]
MTRIEVLLRPSRHNVAERAVCYRVSRDGKAHLLKTNYIVMDEEWDEETNSVFVVPGARSSYLLQVQHAVQKDVDRLENIVARLDERVQGYSAMDVAKLFVNQAKSNMFCPFMREVIGKLRRMGKVRTAETYEATLRSFMIFRRQRDVAMENMDSDLMRMYEAWLMDRGVTKNTSSFYMRIMRAVYNRAVERQITSQRMPFRHVYTGVDKTTKRAVGMKEVKRLRALELEERPALAFARDMFLFSFYTRGMSFVDMAFLRRDALRNGVLTYCRRKTHQQIVVKWEHCMQEIADRWGKAESPYLLGIIRRCGADERRQYMNAQCAVNANLKKVAALAGMRMPLTMYVARHSWASIARNSNVPLAVISEGMGHDSESTTRIYLASLDNSAIDRANAMILRMVQG